MKNKGVIKDALLINIITLSVVALFYFCSSFIFSILSTNQDDTWLLSKYITLRNNYELPQYCDNIMICDISGVDTRDSIATILSTLQSYRPAVIGCDIIFPKTSLNDSIADASLANAVASYPAMVMAVRPVYDATGTVISYEESFFGGEHKGDVTVYPDGRHMLYAPGVPYMSFPSAVADVVKEGIDYPNRRYSLNYPGRYIPVMSIDKICREDVEGKVVLIGDIKDLRDYIDLKFSVSDHNYSNTFSTTNRISGILLHAYAVAAILNEDWVIIMPGWISLLVGFLASFGLSLITRLWGEKNWEMAYLKMIKSALILFMIWVCYPIYVNFNLIFNPLYFTIAIAMHDYSSALLNIIRIARRKIAGYRKKC